MDFGNGFYDLEDGRTYTHSFDSSGIYTFVLRIQYQDGSTYYSKSYVDILFKGAKNSTFHPSYSKPIVATQWYLGESSLPPGMPYTSPYGAGTAHVYLACGHEDIVKPFIWVEGYNPRMSETIDLSLDFEQALLRLSYSNDEVIGDLNILEHLQNEGYDIIVLDYQDGGNYIQRNAYFFVEALKWINEVKREQGSIEKNVVMGQSMGGMVARYGLRWMEVNNIDHETATYISFDTGHQGTNVPLGAQMAVRHVAGLNVGLSTLANHTLETFVAPLRDARKLLDLPASRQMLMVQNTNFSLHSQYYLEQNVELGMPQNCDILTIANGSVKGLDGGMQPFSAGERILRAATNNIILFNGLIAESLNDASATNVGVPFIIGSVWSGPFMAFLLGNNAFCDMELFALPSGSGTVYRGIVQASVLGIPLILSGQIGNISNARPIDSSPGGIIGPIFKENLPPLIALPVFKLNSWSFTPTVSTLHYRGSYNHPMAQNGLSVVNAPFTNPTPLLQQNYVFDVNHYIGQSSATQYYRVNDETGTQYPESVTLNGTKHTFFNPRIAPWFLYHVVGQSVPTSMTSLQGESFNFGKTGIQPESYYQSSVGPVRTQSLLGHSLSIDNDGLLAVNANASIGFSNSGYGITEDNTVFSVRVKGGECADDLVEITVNDGGQLIIGDGDNRKGEMVFYANTKLIINEGGEVIVRPGSNMLFEKGSELILNGGRLHIEDNARVMQKRQSPMTVNEHSEFMLTGHGSLYYTHGQINLGDNTTFKIETATNAKGRIVFRGSEMQSAQWGVNCSMYFIGDHRDDELIRFERKGMLVVTPDLTGNVLNQLRIMHCTVNYTEDTEEHNAIISTSRTLCTNVKFVNNHSSLSQNMRLGASSAIRNCEFYKSGIWSYLASPHEMLSVLYCTFDSHQGFGINGHAIRNERGRAFVDYCTFNQCRSAIRTEDLMVSSIISNNLFTNPVEYSNVLNDDSHVDVNFKQNKVYNYTNVISHKYGKLNMLCNEIMNTTSQTILSQHGILDFSNYYKSAGYNKIESAHNQPLIIVSNSDLLLSKGYNKFRNFGRLAEGFLPWSCINSQSCVLSAIGNQWSNTLQPPSPNKFAIASSNSIPVTVETSPSVALQSCRIFDGGGVIGTPVYAFNNNTLLSIFNTDQNENRHLMKVKTASFDDVRLDVALLTGMFVMKRRDSLYGDNVLAMNLMSELIADDSARKTLVNNPDLFAVLLSEMKYLMHEEFVNDLNASWPVSQFSTIQDQYNTNLNKLSKELENAKLDNRTFALEMEKVSFLRFLGNESLALQLLEGIEQCGVDSLAQVQINHHKRAVIRSLQITSKSNPLHAFESKYREVDTTGFVLPEHAIPAENYKGAVIVSPISLSMETCSNGKSLDNMNEDNSLRVQVYPNPNNGSFTVLHDCNACENVDFYVYSMSGQVVLKHRLTEQKSQVSMQSVRPGVYYYNFITDGEINKVGKLVVR